MITRWCARVCENFSRHTPDGRWWGGLDGHEAVRQVLELKPDLVILDLAMPH